MIFRPLLICLFVCIAVARVHSQSYVEFYEAGMKAGGEGDNENYLANMAMADSLRPLHPVILFRLGSALVLNQQMEKGIETLKKSLMLNARLPLETDEALSGLRNTPGFDMLLDFRDSLLKPVESSQIAFALEEKDLHPEGIAYDPESRKWYISSVHKRKIVTRDNQGEVGEFKKSGEDGLMAVMGMAADLSKRLLWVTSVPAKEMQDQENTGPAAVLSFDLDNGNLKTKYIAGDTLEHWFGDLAVDSRGRVFITDSFTNLIYIIENGSMSPWLDTSPAIGNIQGIVVSGRHLIVSDYLSSIYRIDMSDKSIQKIINPFPELILKGTDGLMEENNELYLTINGQVPNSLIRLTYDVKLFKITNYQVKDKNHSSYGEPTLGTITGDRLYYIANSPWGAYAGDSQLDSTKYDPPRILMLDLNR